MVIPPRGLKAIEKHSKHGTMDWGVHKFQLRCPAVSLIYPILYLLQQLLTTPSPKPLLTPSYRLPNSSYISTLSFYIALHSLWNRLQHQYLINGYIVHSNTWLWKKHNIILVYSSASLSFRWAIPTLSPYIWIYIIIYIIIKQTSK